MKEKTRIYMKNRASALFLDSIYWITYMVVFLQWMQGSLYRKVIYPSLDTSNYMSGWIQGENGNCTKISEEKYPKESVANIGRLQEPFRRRKWCLRDFADTQESCEIFSQQQVKLAGLRNWLPPWGSQRSSLRLVSGSFRRNSIALYKKAAKFSQQKADSATL